MSDQAPSVDVLSGYDPGVAIAADDSFTIGKAKYDGAVTAVSFIPEGAAIGDGANKRTYRLINKGQSGGGGAVIATLDLNAGVDLVAYDEKAATLNAAANATKVLAGDVFAWTSMHNGTGLVDPGGAVRVEITRG